MLCLCYAVTMQRITAMGIGQQQLDSSLAASKRAGSDGGTRRRAASGKRLQNASSTLTEIKPESKSVLMSLEVTVAVIVVRVLLCAFVVLPLLLQQQNERSSDTGFQTLFILFCFVLMLLLLFVSQLLQSDNQTTKNSCIYKLLKANDRKMAFNQIEVKKSFGCLEAASSIVSTISGG